MPTAEHFKDGILDSYSLKHIVSYKTLMHKYKKKIPNHFSAGSI